LRSNTPKNAQLWIETAVMARVSFFCQHTSL
jgi:hypothetical protein